MVKPVRSGSSVAVAQEKLNAMIDDIVENYRQDPNEALASMAQVVLDSDTFEGMFDTQDLAPARELFNVGLMVEDVSFNKSSYAEGLPYFATLHGKKIADGTEFIANCGAWQAVTVAYKMVKNGWLPRAIQFREAEHATANGFYPISILPWDEAF